MPKSAEKKWIKRFNRENGKGTPLLMKTKAESNKKLKIGDVLKAGQHFLFGSSDETSKQSKVNKTLFKDSPIICEDNEKQIYRQLTPSKNQTSVHFEEQYPQSSGLSNTPISQSLENATKKVRLSVRKVGNREPIVM